MATKQVYDVHHLMKSARPGDRSNSPVVFLPHYCDLGERLQRLGRLHGRRVYFKSSPNLRSLVRNDKIKIPFEERTAVVYEIKRCCTVFYMGETGNTLLYRFNEHKKTLYGSRTAKEELNGICRNRRDRP
ncbi:hypothetical protein M514_00595 [Trichuris suis]|uniref:GIY-YIG domain-containing protein n=1 Tax=Trichuris suis TaxID=68888 RepID=A0A085MSM0_9BILA|nr:hypothetical protein M513_00595 [Trichuris suis]KFD60216.1 hypothetical protein M514_00595 [Trichuris suis]